MKIRKATREDLDKIWEIYEKVRLDRSRLGDSQYEAEIQRKGFLTGQDTKQDIGSQIDGSWAFLVAVEGEKIVGFTIVEQNREYRDDEYKTWFDLKLKDIYYNSPKMLGIMSLAVDPQSGRKGIASTLLAEVERMVKNSEMEYLFTVITMAPVTNCPMIAWRTKVGFKRLAMGRPREELFGIKWYASLLMYKNLNEIHEA